MTKDLEIVSNWTPFLKNNQSSYTFDQFLDIIKQMDNESSPDLWFKWKNFVNQVVIETPNFYFKLYEDFYNTGCFLYEIRRNLAEIYQEKFNILWEINKVEANGKIYTFEKRQKLTVCTPNCMTYADLLLNWSHTLQELEKRLLLKEICEQLKPNIPCLAEIKLIRDCINKYADYAITEQNEIILLDDADWFLALVDKDGKWLSSRHRGYNIVSGLGETIFAPIDYFKENSITEIDELKNKWQIFVENENMDRLDSKLRDWREEMLMNNIQLISKQQLIPGQEIKYFELDNSLPRIGHE